MGLQKETETGVFVSKHMDIVANTDESKCLGRLFQQHFDVANESGTKQHKWKQIHPESFKKNISSKSPLQLGLKMGRLQAMLTSPRKRTSAHKSNVQDGDSQTMHGSEWHEMVVE